MVVRLLAFAFLIPTVLCGGNFTVQEENDLFALSHRSDRSYTNGTRLLWEWAPRESSWAERTARRLCYGVKDCDTRTALGLVQTMYTPENLKCERPIPGDRPYGGWLAALAIADGVTERTIDHLEVYAGIVGPHAYSKQTQTFIHRSRGYQLPMGWANQISDRPGVEAIYERRWRTWPKPGTLRDSVDFTPAVSGGVGTVFDYVAASSTLRLGFHLPDRFFRSIPAPAAAPPPQASAMVAEPDRKQSRWDAFVFATATGRVIAYNVFLDAAPAIYGISRKPWVYDKQYGVSARLFFIRAQYAHTIRSIEFTPERSAHRYGIITLSVGNQP
jgi:hypothetical protein